jgi:hypothetical protein
MVAKRWQTKLWEVMLVLLSMPPNEVSSDLLSQVPLFPLPPGEWKENLYHNKPGGLLVMGSAL